MPPTEIITNPQNLPSKAISADRKLVFDFLDWEEPNNGRNLWRINVLFEGRNINREVFKGNWNCINFSIDQLELSSPDSRHYFIPAEGSGALYLPSGQVHRLPGEGTSTVTFEGNLLSNDFVLQVFSDQLLLTDLKSLRTTRWQPEELFRISKADWKAAQEIEVTLYHRKAHQHIPQILSFDAFRSTVP